MDDFEKKFQSVFPAITKKTGVFLHFLFPPVRCIGSRGSQPIFVQTGRAVFDVAGWRPVLLEEEDKTLAVSVGIELKRNGDLHSSMRIVGEDGSGSGIQAHQLEALASLHRAGGIAKVLWCNGGDVGVLDGADIQSIFFNYGVSVQAEKMRKAVAKGARSIPWSLFRKVDLDTDPSAVIIAPEADKTVAEVLKASRRKARKQLKEADDERKSREPSLAEEMESLIGDDD